MIAKMIIQHPISWVLIHSWCKFQNTAFQQHMEQMGFNCSWHLITSQNTAIIMKSIQAAALYVVCTKTCQSSAATKLSKLITECLVSGLLWITVCHLLVTHIHRKPTSHTQIYTCCICALTATALLSMVSQIVGLQISCEENLVWSLSCEKYTFSALSSEHYIILPDPSEKAHSSHPAASAGEWWP